jgi:hypothetical protein
MNMAVHMKRKTCYSLNLPQHRTFLSIVPSVLVETLFPLSTSKLYKSSCFLENLHSFQYYQPWTATQRLCYSWQLGLYLCNCGGLFCVCLLIRGLRYMVMILPWHVYQVLSFGNRYHYYPSRRGTRLIISLQSA